MQGRAQAENETTIGVNPFNPQQMLAASNDYRLGDGGCFPSYSLDGGRTWNDTTIPWNFNRGASFNGAAREYWQTCGDPFVIGYDTKGNAYFGGLQFNRGSAVTNDVDASSAVYVWRSTQNAGASWDFPGRPVVEDYDTSGATPLRRALRRPARRQHQHAAVHPVRRAVHGDYSGLAAYTNANPLWTDTRNPDLSRPNAGPPRVGRRADRASRRDRR